MELFMWVSPPSPPGKPRSGAEPSKAYLTANVGSTFHTITRSRATQQQQSPLYSLCSGQPASAGTSSEELEDYVGAKFYRPHALADRNQRIWIREKTLESSSAILLCSPLKGLGEGGIKRSICLSQ